MTAVPRRTRRAIEKDQPLPTRAAETSSFTADGVEGESASAKRDPFINTWRCQVDVWQRWVLFLDTLRVRANTAFEHEAAGLPPVLNFEYESILDARHFKPPANYALLRITEAEGVCLANCLDEAKQPVIVVDPRAGHGPGIGGFKRESEVGIALREGHPVYFVVFQPDPCPRQTLADVLHALRRFVEEVGGRHPGKPPVLYGNCQAGWAIALLAADCAGLSGPAVLNGSPLSYWAGEAGANPMRLTGGLLGGTWLPRYLADLGNGEFDGAWLVQNFENLNPANALWDKYAKLFADVDKERERFLEFERWWNGFYRFSREEITAIVENLFVGNRLEEGKVRICEGCVVDLTRIRGPLVIFASSGDNITPPHQALGWIPAVYDSTEDLKAHGQRIVYLLNPHIGHLGIFVSAKVARLEHRAILESLEEIETLEPGLYEMTIDNPSGDPDCHKPQYAVTFHERRIEDLDFPYDRSAFERVRTMSELNDDLYRVFTAPWVQMLVTPWTAALVRELHPLRASRYPFAERYNPWMAGLALLAEAVREHRAPLSAEHPWRHVEAQASEQISAAFDAWREARDRTLERVFSLLYGR